MANSEIKLMSSGGLKAVITELAGAYERASGTSWRQCSLRPRR